MPQPRGKNSALSTNGKRSSAKIAQDNMAPLPILGEDTPVEILSNDDKADKFWNSYEKRVDPYIKYSSFIKNTGVGAARFCRDVKLYYKKMVLEEGWPANKYVAVIDRMFTSGRMMNPSSFGSFGMMYDREEAMREKRRR